MTQRGKDYRLGIYDVHRNDDHETREVVYEFTQVGYRSFDPTIENQYQDMSLMWAWDQYLLIYMVQDGNQTF